MSSIEKEWKELLKPATPPTDLPSVIQWATSIAAIFNKPLVQAAKVVIDFVSNMIPIIQKIIKKLVSSKTLLTQCAPTLAANAASPPTIIPALITHYIKPSTVGLNISQLKFDPSNPAVIVDSITKIIQQYFPIDTIFSKQQKIKQRVIRDLYCKPKQHFCESCLTGVYKKKRFVMYSQSETYSTLINVYLNDQQSKEEYDKYKTLNDDYNSLSQTFSVSGICFNCLKKQFNTTKSLSRDFTLIYEDVNHMNSQHMNNLYTQCRNCNTVDTLYNMTDINKKTIFGVPVLYSNYLCSSCFKKYKQEEQKKLKKQQEINE